MCKQVLAIFLLTNVVVAQDLSYIDLLRPYKEFKSVSDNRIGYGRTHIVSSSSVYATRRQVNDLRLLVESQIQMLGNLIAGQKKLIKEKSRYGKWYKHTRKYLKKIYKSCTCEARDNPARSRESRIFSDMPYEGANFERIVVNSSGVMLNKVESDSNDHDAATNTIDENGAVQPMGLDLESRVHELELVTDSEDVQISLTTTTTVTPPTLKNPPSVSPVRGRNDASDSEGLFNVVANLETGTVAGNNSDINWLVYPLEEVSAPCSRQGLVRLNFQNPSFNQSHDKMKIDMWFDTPEGWVFNVGDSKSNDGWSGDGITQENDSEAQGYGTAFSVHASDKSSNPYKKMLYEDKDFIKTRVTLIVSDETIAWSNHYDNFNFVRNHALFALNSQTDRQGPVNFDVYLSFNRVIAGSYRSGRGLCKIALKWLD